VPVVKVHAEAQLIAILLEALEFVAAAARFGREGLARVFSDEHEVVFIELLAGGPPLTLLATLLIGPLVIIITSSLTSSFSTLCCLASFAHFIFEHEIELFSAPLPLPLASTASAPLFTGLLVVHVLYHEAVILVVIGLVLQIFFFAAVVEAEGLITRFLVVR
jgi:hypothetical protein